MGYQRKLRRFFRNGRGGLDTPGARRPVIDIPEDWQIDYIFSRVCTAGIGVSYRDILDWKYSWTEIWEMHDMLDLQAWIDWKVQAFVEETKQG